MSIYGKVRTANTMLEDKKKVPDWKIMKAKTQPLTCTVDGEVIKAIKENAEFIRFRYGSMSQYLNYLLAKDLGLLDEKKQ